MPRIDPPLPELTVIPAGEPLTYLALDADGALTWVGSTTSPATPIFVNVTEPLFGAVGDGIADDTDAIEAAIAAVSAAGGGTVYFPQGTFLLSTTQAATAHVRLMGEGIGNVASGGITPVTKIRWTGGAAKMFTSDAWTNAWSFSDICLDGNGLATHGVHATAMVDQHWGSTAIIGCTDTGLLLEGQTPAGNTHFNVFDKLVIQANSPTGTAIELTGDGPSNVCHNVFAHIEVSFTGDTPGVLFGDSDNNTVILLFIYHNSGTAYGLDLNTNARANFFWHVELPGGAMPGVSRAGTFNSITHYDTSNGQVFPVLEGDAILEYRNIHYGDFIKRLTIINDDGSNVLFNWSGSNNHYIRGGNTDVDTTLHVSKAFSLIDGLAAPATVAGKAFIYVDSADGDLKIKFGDGTVKTIVVDT